MKLKCPSVLQDAGSQDHRQADLSEVTASITTEKERHVTNKKHPRFSLPCPISSWDRELILRRVVRMRAFEHQRWLSELDSSPTDKNKLGRATTVCPAGDKSQHSKSQLDWRKTWPAMSGRSGLGGNGVSAHQAAWQQAGMLTSKLPGTREMVNELLQGVMITQGLEDSMKK